MEIVNNPFKFVDIVRQNGRILIVATVGVQNFTMTKEALEERLVSLREINFTDHTLAQELLALREYNREVQRDNWDNIIIDGVGD